MRLDAVMNVTCQTSLDVEMLNVFLLPVHLSAVCCHGYTAFGARKYLISKERERLEPWSSYLMLTSRISKIVFFL